MVAFLSLVSLTLWYGELSIEHLSHMLAQSILGVLFTLPLHWVSNKVWHQRSLLRLFSVFCTVIAIAFVWTIVRMHLFTAIFAHDPIWHDFGGWFFSSIFIYLCWAGFYHGLKYARLLRVEHDILLKKTAEAKEQELKTIVAQSAARDAKIKMLRYQLNPHFLCNTLNAINSLIETGHAETAQSMSVQLSKFLRFSLDTNPDIKLALEFELKALNLYLEIEKIRFGDRLQLEFDIEPQAQHALVPNLLLQPIIENSMKHVIAKNENGGTISFEARVVDDKLVLVIRDTGPEQGLSQRKVKGNSGRGVGLKNIDERLKVLYHGNYQFSFAIGSSGGLKTVIKIPFEQQDE